MGEQKGALALPEIPVDLLAVSRHVPVEVQDVVCDLERRADEEAEAIEPVENPIAGIRDKGTDRQRVNEAVPGGLLQHETKIVVRRDSEIVVAHPAELHGLPLEGLDDQGDNILENEHRSLPLS